jgi:putative phosphoserine phosphatase/1-acylglycerol-3-phosphate O-acyltransferase
MSQPSGVRTALNVLGGCVLVTGTALAMLVVRLVTLSRARRFCAEVLGATLCKAILGMLGVKLVVHEHAPLPPGQYVYTFNHTSTFDQFIVIALGLPRTRYFMKRASWIFPPFGLGAWLLGTFFTPPQRLPQARVRCFQSAADTLRRTGDSVLLSPEGTRVLTGKIGRFNKGAFHLATHLHAPIVPLFIQIPPESNPGKGFVSRPCTVLVHQLPSVSTADWRLEDLEQNKERVRQLYADFIDRLSAAPAVPGSPLPLAARGHA